MRKKSHISLASHLVNEVQNAALAKHKKAFCLGSILPDCKPSFLTTKHEFTGTFERIQERIERLANDQNRMENHTQGYIRELGEVIHYMADYFTFPHNSTYEGNLKDHCFYEKELKFQLKAYIKSGRAALEEKESLVFEEVEQLFSYIKKSHEEYLSCVRTVEEDCKYILHITYQVVQGIFQILYGNRQRSYVIA